jgi:hypothetical protein
VQGVTHGWVNNTQLVITTISILHDMDKCHEPQSLYKKGQFGLRAHPFCTLMLDECRNAQIFLGGPVLNFISRMY